MYYLLHGTLFALAICFTVSVVAVECDSNDTCGQQTNRSLSEQQNDQTFPLTTQECEQGNGAACAVLASTYFFDVNEDPQHLAKTYAVASKGCAFDNAVSCVLLAAMQFEGKATAKDYGAGEANLKKACTLDSDLCEIADNIRHEFKWPR